MCLHADMHTYLCVTAHKQKSEDNFQETVFSFRHVYPRDDDASELPRGCWEPNPGHLQEQQVLLITGSSLLPSFCLFYMCVCGGVVVHTHMPVYIG